MKIVKAFLFLAFMLIYTQADALAVIKSGQNFISPNKIYVASIRFDGEWKLSVKNNKNGEIEVFGILNPIYSIKWTGDSRVIISVSHIAHGSAASYIFLNKNKYWTDIDPPQNSELAHHAYGVVGLDVGFNTVKLTYKVADRTSNSGDLIDDFYVCTFDFNPETGVISNEVKRKIDLNSYDALKLLGQ